jgi:DNA-directed RNA polymerase specialized sigma24 family protein
MTTTKLTSQSRLSDGVSTNLMTVDPDLLARARKDDRKAVVELAAAFYPSVYRMSHALGGRKDVGDGIVRFVMKQSFRAMANWKDEDAPARWFRHHTVLTARRAARHRSTTTNDVLIPPAAGGDAAFGAFVAAIRALPRQQAEAIILHHGEKLELRAMAVAMDCSTVAAATHLSTAHETLTELNGREVNTLLARLGECYAALEPSEELILGRVRSGARGFLWPRKLARFLRAMFVLAILVGMAWFAITWWREIVAWLKEVLSR